VASGTHNERWPMLMKLPVQVLESRPAATMVAGLRASPFIGNDFFVLNGAMTTAGMAPFKSVLSRDGVTAIRACLIQRANQDKAPASPSRYAEGAH
jgi:hypothetical protein